MEGRMQKLTAQHARCRLEMAGEKRKLSFAFGDGTRLRDDGNRLLQLSSVVQGAVEAAGGCEGSRLLIPLPGVTKAGAAALLEWHACAAHPAWNICQSWERIAGALHAGDRLDVDIAWMAGTLARVKPVCEPCTPKLMAGLLAAAALLMRSAAMSDALHRLLSKAWDDLDDQHLSSAQVDAVFGAVMEAAESLASWFNIPLMSGLERLHIPWPIFARLGDKTFKAACSAAIAIAAARTGALEVALDRGDREAAQAVILLMKPEEVLGFRAPRIERFLVDWTQPWMNF